MIVLDHLAKRQKSCPNHASANIIKKKTVGVPSASGDLEQEKVSFVHDLIRKFSSGGSHRCLMKTSYTVIIPGFLKGHPTTYS